MCESSKGSDKTTQLLRHVWALIEIICHMNAHFVHVRQQWRLLRNSTHAQAPMSIDWWYMPYVRPFCARMSAMKTLARLHAYLVSFEYWQKEYAVCTPNLRMCESSEGSGETARMLRFVWALTDKRCHIYTHFVYVREQWRLWQTACILSLVWVLTESICGKYAHFVHVREQ